MPILLLLTHFFLIPGLALDPKPAHATPAEYFIPALKKISKQQLLGAPLPSGESYSGSTQPPSQKTPRIPFLPWGLHCEQDWLISLAGDPGWGMIEIIRVRPPGQAPVWFTLDSRLDGTQYVGLPSNHPQAKKLATFFPAPSYEAGLTVQESGPREARVVRVRYTRKDGARIDFTMQASTLPNPGSYRNGNAMNHSERGALAVIDLESFRFAKGGVTFEKDPGRPDISRGVQRIAGVPIAGLLVQTVGGFMTSRWQQRETLLFRHGIDPSLPQESGTLTWTAAPGGDSGVLEQDSGFQKLAWNFDIYRSPERPEREYYELRSVSVRQVISDTSEPREVLRAEFNPALPDLRYPLTRPLTTSKWVIAVAGQDAYSHGTIRIDREQDDLHLTLAPEWPHWTRERPLVTNLKASTNKSGFDGASLVLVPGIASQSSSQATARPTSGPIPVLQSFDFAWELRPHRLSRFLVRLPGTLTESDPGEWELGGGTWANGESASDRALGAISTGLISNQAGGRSFLVSSPVFPLVQEKRQLLKKALVLGTHSLEVALPAPRPGMTYLAAVNGFEFKPGPLHESTGLTISGLGMDITDQKRTGGQTPGLTLSLRMEQLFTAVPDRLQDFENYSALGRMHLVIFEVPETGTGTSQTFTARRTEPRLFFPDGDGLEARCTRESELNLVPWLFTGLQFRIEDKSYFGGRYIRKLRAAALPTDFTERFSNAGEIARETPWSLTKTLVSDPSLSWSDPAKTSPLGCLETPATR